MNPRHPSTTTLSLVRFRRDHSLQAHGLRTRIRFLISSQRQGFPWSFEIEVESQVSQASKEKGKGAGGRHHLS